MIKNNKNVPFIELPLIIGAEQLLLKDKKIVLINSLDYKINLSLKNDKALQSFINDHNQKQQRHEFNYKILNNKELLISTKQSQDFLSFHQQTQQQNLRFYIYKNHQQQFWNQDQSSNLLPKFKNSNSQSRHNESREFKFSYMVRLNKNINNSRIKIEVIQENYEFELTKISSNVKFVKNSILDNLFKNQIVEQSGLLSMDKQNRMLIESCKMSYPVIGYWVKSSKDIQSAQNYQYFSQFIKQKYERRCLFKVKNCSQKKYFYFVNLCYQTKAIDVYLISWYQNQHLIKFADVFPTQKMIRINHKQLKQLQILQKMPSCNTHQKYISTANNSNISNIKPFFILKQNKQQRQRPSSSSLNDYTFQIQSQNKSKLSPQKSNQQRQFDITIRREDKKYELSKLQSLINYSYLSPIKQLQNGHNQQIGPFFLNSQQKSPQFSTCTKNNNFQYQCIDLRLQVKDQQNQIRKLRQTILQMQSELKMYKNSRLSTNCQSNKKRSKFGGYAGFSSSTSSIDIKSHTDSNNSSPKDIRRLRQSDLKSQSLILSDMNKNSSNKKQKFNFGTSQQSSESNKKEIQKQKLDFIDKQPVVLSFVSQFKQRKIQNLPQITEQEGKDQFDNYVLIDS